MSRKNGNAGGRRFDTSLSFEELCRRTGINTRQRIIMRRYFINRIKGVSKTD